LAADICGAKEKSAFPNSVTGYISHTPGQVPCQISWPEQNECNGISCGHFVWFWYILSYWSPPPRHFDVHFFNFYASERKRKKNITLDGR